MGLADPPVNPQKAPRNSPMILVPGVVEQLDQHDAEVDMDAT